MTKRDYIAVAAILRGDIESQTPKCKLALQNTGRSLADMFARDNHRFDRDRFYIAAGIKNMTAEEYLTALFQAIEDDCEPFKDVAERAGLIDAAGDYLDWEASNLPTEH